MATPASVVGDRCRLGHVASDAGKSHRFRFCHRLRFCLCFGVYLGSIDEPHRRVPSLGAAACASPSTCFVGGALNEGASNVAVVYATSDGGVNWTQQSLPAKAPSDVGIFINQISCPSATECFASGNTQTNGFIFETSARRHQLDLGTRIVLTPVRRHQLPDSVDLFCSSRREQWRCGARVDDQRGNELDRESPGNSEWPTSSFWAKQHCLFFRDRLYGGGGTPYNHQRSNAAVTSNAGANLDDSFFATRARRRDRIDVVRIEPTSVPAWASEPLHSVRCIDDREWRSDFRTAGEALPSEFMYGVSCPTATSCTAVGQAAEGFGPGTIFETSDAGASWQEESYPGQMSAFSSVGCSLTQCVTDGDVAIYYLAHSGTAQFYGSMGGKPLNQTIVGMAATPDGKGYWEVASDGGLFAFGDATFYGSMGGQPLNAADRGHDAPPPPARATGRWPATAACSPSARPVLRLDGRQAPERADRRHGRNARRPGLLGGGQRRRAVRLRRCRLLRLDGWQTAQQADRRDDGHPHRQGLLGGGQRRRAVRLRHAQFYGSMGGKPLNEPIVGMASTPDGKGYWEVASDGGLFAFGDAAFYGSMGGQPLNKPIVGMTATPTGKGYWEVASDGGLFAF